MALTRRLAAAATVLALTALPTACAAAPSASSAPATPSAVPTQSLAGVTLAGLGFANGPDVLLPAGLKPDRSIDQPNVVALFFSQPTPDSALIFLRNSLPQAGFAITADGGGSLVFESGAWTGSFTATNGYGALTFRRR